MRPQHKPHAYIPLSAEDLRASNDEGRCLLFQVTHVHLVLEKTYTACAWETEQKIWLWRSGALSLAQDRSL